MRPAPSTRPGAADPRALRGPARVITALLLSLLLLLTACGDQGGAAGSSASGGGGADSEQYAASLEKAATALKQNAVDDPKSITGPTEAASVPDVEPISDPSQPKLPVTVKDHQGTEVTVTDTSRILALDLYGTLAQTVEALGQGDKLAGRVTSSTEESLKDLPLVTENGHDLNAEAIMKTAPTVVLMDTTNGPTEITEQLRSAGITVVHFSPDRRMDLIDGQIQKVADALGVPEDGKRLGERMQKDLDHAIQTIRDVAPGEDGKKLSMAFLYVRGNAGVFFILGKGSGADDLITSLSGIDAATEKGVEDIVPATSEALVKLNPDLILAMSKGIESTGGIDGFLARPGVGETTAGKNRRVVSMADGQILSFGPNTPAVLLSLAQAVYAPDAVSGDGASS
ncbi:Hemin-binding periplasmic protein hmuT precursor [Rothia kristinae]|uniref:heme/hemin ABC transporter substrate-binding protein n=1 Tax=Rothia kristinae TaxID=37923 RepID=UPI0009BEBF8A|nr:ABC transporter substrate-binding protein [Rothia kristinae]SQC37882.1 Hemin-binding periplasmic protein hmuT precursor [Rothia kristinae]